jgi:outer membrane protein assembly factor BamB
VQLESFSNANERDCSVSRNENSSCGLPIKSILFSTGGPMDSAWPLFGQNVHHTCLSPFSTENNSGAELWRVSGDYQGEVESSAIVDRNGTIYFGTMGPDHSLYALYPNGTRKWRFHASGLIWSTPALADNGDIYCTKWGDSYLYAITANGTERWRFDQESSSGSSPTIGSDGTIYLGTDGHVIFAVNLNGTEKWRYVTSGIVMGSPAIGNDGTIYVGSGDHYLYALYPNGTLKWRFDTGSYIKGSASIASDGTIYAPSFNDYFYALCPNGTLKWQASTGGSVAAAGVAIAPDGTLIVGTEQLRAYYPNGTLKWITDLQGDIYGTVPAVSADGTIYVSAGCDLVAVNPDGSERWRRTIADTWARSSPSIGADGTVYVGSTWGSIMSYGYLHAFGNGSSNIPTAPTITGEINGRIKTSYSYTFTSTSPQDKDIYYLIDWGDGSTSGWLGPYNSGETLTISHSWETKGTYMIKARAKDTDNRWGPWGTLSVTMPCSYERPFMTIFDKLLERFPFAFPILRYLLIE